MPGATAIRRRGGVPVRTIKWTAEDFAAEPEGTLPIGEEVFEEWSYGDLEAGFGDAALVLDETFVTAGNSHHSMEPRTNMAYWEDGRCHLFASSQSQSFILHELARLMDVPEEDIRLVAEYCGGGFGSKGHAYPLMAIPALLSRKIGRPVMMRMSRAEEYFLGIARGGFQGRIRLGFSAEGRILAADLRVVQDGGPTEGFFRLSRRCGTRLRGPDAGGDAVAGRPRPHQHHSPRPPARSRPEPDGRRSGTHTGQGGRGTGHRPAGNPHDQRAPPRLHRLRSAHSGHQRLHGGKRWIRGAAAFDWEEKRARSGLRNGSKVRGVAIGQGFHAGSFAGYDGLVRLTPEGRLHIHTGVGNLGTYSHTATSRVAAEVLGCRWENCVVERGDTNRFLPFNSGQYGSNTSGTQTRTTYAAAMDAVKKLKADRGDGSGRGGVRLRHRRREGVSAQRSFGGIDLSRGRAPGRGAGRTLRRT